MQSPVQVTFRDMLPSPAVTAHVEKRAAKLDTFFDRIVSCKVTIENPHRHRAHGARFQVVIEVHVPGKAIVVSRNPDDAKLDAHVAIDEAFGDAERMLEDFSKGLKPATKERSKAPHGVITKLFFDRGYGFIQASDDDAHEVYFHENSVLGARFEKLTLGTRVRFAEEDGDKGPQASTVHVIGAL